MRSHPKKWHLLIPDAAPRGDSSYIWIPLDSSSRANPGLLGCLKCNKIWIIIDIIYYWYKHAMQSSFWTWCWCPKADPCTSTCITLVLFRIAAGWWRSPCGRGTCWTRAACSGRRGIGRGTGDCHHCTWTSVTTQFLPRCLLGWKMWTVLSCTNITVRVFLYKYNTIPAHAWEGETRIF